MFAEGWSTEATPNAVFQNNLHCCDAAALAHLEKACTRAGHTTRGETPPAQDAQTHREEAHYPEIQKEAGKHLILKTILSKQFSIYFNICSYLKETGYRLCGRI